MRFSNDATHSLSRQEELCRLSCLMSPYTHMRSHFSPFLLFLYLWAWVYFRHCNVSRDSCHKWQKIQWEAKTSTDLGTCNIPGGRLDLPVPSGLPTIHVCFLPCLLLHSGLYLVHNNGIVLPLEFLCASPSVWTYSFYLWKFNLNVTAKEPMKSLLQVSSFLTHGNSKSKRRQNLLRVTLAGDWIWIHLKDFGSRAAVFSTMLSHPGRKRDTLLPTWLK